MTSKILIYRKIVVKYHPLKKLNQLKYKTIEKKIPTFVYIKKNHFILK